MALKPVCRLGDTASGMCSNHPSAVPWTGVVTIATGGFTVDGIQVATLGDGGTTSCGHEFTITSASAVCTAPNGKKIARKDDEVTVTSIVGIPTGAGAGTLTSGSSTCSSE